MTFPLLSISKIKSSALPDEICLSPSKVSFLSDGCGASEMLRLKLKTAYAGSPMEYSTIPSNPYAPITGNVLHRLANYCSHLKEWDEDKIFDMAEKYIQDEFQKLKEQWPMLGNSRWRFDYGKVYDLIDSISAKRSNTTKEGSQGKVYTEKNLDCGSTLGLLGKPDYFWVNGEEAVIKDYKTGEITDEKGDIKDSYKVQLNLYRLMIEEEYPEVRDVKMAIEDLRGKSWPVKKIEDDVLHCMIDKVQTSISMAEYNPGTHCHSCGSRHICLQREWPNINSLDYLEFKGNVSFNEGGLRLHDMERNLTIEISRTEDSSEFYQVLSAMSGKTIYLTNLKKISEAPLICILTSSTIGCELES